MQPTRHSILVPNLLAPGGGKHEIVFYEWGDPAAERVTVCVHGLTRNARDFDLLAQALAASGRRVLSLNMAGRGDSAWLADPVDYNYGSYVADCLAVLDNFHLRGVEWVGTSMGGIIGMIIAAKHSDRIKKLVLNDIGSFISAKALGRIYDYVRAIPSSFANFSEADAYLSGIFAPFGITDSAQWEHFSEHSVQRLENGRVRLAVDPAIAEPLRQASHDFTEVHDVHLGEVWKEVDQPTLILRGALSDVLDAETVSAMRSTHLLAETATIEGVGHAPSLMDPAQIRRVLQWLQGAHVYGL